MMSDGFIQDQLSLIIIAHYLLFITHNSIA
jgi:hypothetical protein